MKTLYRYFTIVLLLFNINHSFGQVEVWGTEDILLKLRINKSIEGNRNNTYRDIEGDPFMYKEFTKGSIELTDGSIYNEMIRFDKYAGEIHFKKGNEIYAIAYPEKIESIHIDDLKFIYDNYRLTPSGIQEKMGSYFIVLADGEIKLLAKKRTTIKESLPSNGIVGPQPASFRDQDDEYFIKIGDQSAVLVKNKKQLLLILTEMKPKAEDFIKNEHVKTGKVSDLIRLVNFLNQFK